MVFSFPTSWSAIGSFPVSFERRLRERTRNENRDRFVVRVRHSALHVPAL